MNSQKISQSIFQLLILIESLLWIFLASQVLSLIFLVGLLLGFRFAVDRIAVRANEFLSFFHDLVGALAQLSRLLIQVVQAFTAALTDQFPGFLAGKQGGHQPTDGSQP